MKILVTGCAGFIGSHLVEELLARGYEVIGVDCFTEYYSRILKEKNLENLRSAKKFKFLEIDLNEAQLNKIIDGCEIIFHQAAQAGVRSSWGDNFAIYEKNNISVTQKLLESSKNQPLKKFIYASSSSVYGSARKFPIREDHPLQPISPYGVTKLAAENLVYLYWKNFGLPVVSLRYFTVYGPRQRPDMAFTRLIKAVLKKELFEVFGSGQQIRDFTFVADAVAANLSLLDVEEDKILGEVFNIGGGHPVSINEVIKIVEKITGIVARVKYRECQKGDVLETRADTSRAQKILGFKPVNTLEAGIQAQVRWLDSVLRTSPKAFE
jgi:UDP-glucose 4-epimerase